MKKIFCLIIVLGLMVFSNLIHSQSNNSYKIIVNKSNPVSSLEKKEVSKLFYKKTTKWSNGNKVFPVDLIPASPVRILFSKEVHGKSISAVKAYWQKQIFSGRGVPPPEKKITKDILQYVQDNPGAIGYISASTQLEKFAVKVLKVK